MTAKIQAKPTHLLDDDFNSEDLHPADIEQIVIAGYDEYESIPKFTRIKKQYRARFNSLIDDLTEKRGFKQFNYL